MWVVVFSIVLKQLSVVRYYTVGNENGYDRIYVEMSECLFCQPTLVPHDIRLTVHWTDKQTHRQTDRRIMFMSLAPTKLG